MSVPATWVMSLLVALEPSTPWRATYEKTAEAIAKVAESEPLFAEEKGDQRTAALLVAIAWHESRFKPNAKSSNNQWFCLYQIDRRHLGPEPEKALNDQEACSRAAVQIIKGSLAKCKARPAEERLAVFMSGSCEKGLAESRYRTFLANKLLKEHPAPEPPPPPAVYAQRARAEVTSH
ncbi:MAG: transglycosylase SLT domain-containing protein [Deltaproteobacteria bacterium]|nr:transglycosylase SLT domain-containing protein [Deltaproteobacteria bacterium]